MQQLPERFVSEMDRIGLSALPDALASGEPEVSVRLNRHKPAVGFAGATEVPWCDSGLYLPERPLFTLDPCFHQGRYYVQEASSMFHARVVDHLVTLSPGALRVLDACAAPGGKTTAVMDRLPEGSVMVANEYVPARAAVLRENVIKWGYPAAIVTRGDTEALGRLKGMFDLIVADVPCSGEGMMRKDPEAVAQWSPGLVEECAARQWEIVGNLWRALRPGGFMIYSTCTFNRRENEMIVERIISELGGESVEIPVEESWNITPGLSTSAHCYRFIPGRTRGEGLFVSVIRKDGDAPVKDKAAGGKKKGGKDRPVDARVKDRICSPDDYVFTQDGERITAFPVRHHGLLKAVGAETDVIHEGITLAQIKGRDLVPAHALAMSTALNRESLTAVEIDRETALRYLHGESPVLSEGVPAGYVLLTFGNVPLGWVKNLGRRTNSLYPQQWRIRRNLE